MAVHRYCCIASVFEAQIRRVIMIGAFASEEPVAFHLPSRTPCLGGLYVSPLKLVFVHLPRHVASFVCITRLIHELYYRNYP